MTEMSSSASSFHHQTPNKIMTHIKNISKLFSKNFVESPLLESFEVGKIYLSSGKLVACDPVITSDMLPFTTEFPKGDFQVLLHKERESNCVAYAEIIFNNSEVSDWQMATTKGQNVKELTDEEVFGYPVESGMACFMDVDTQNSLNELEQKLFQRKGDDFMGIYEEFFHEHFFDENGAIDQFALLSLLKIKQAIFLLLKQDMAKVFMQATSVLMHKKIL